MRAFWVSATFIAFGALLAGCNSNAIGRACVNPTGTIVQGIQISEPALECPSRLCLLTPPAASTGDGTGMGTDEPVTARATCTALCESNGDCEAETKASCAHGFACAVATTIGPICCRKICICRDDLVVGDNVEGDPLTGKIITPFSCVYDADLNPTPICEHVKVPKTQ